MSSRTLHLIFFLLALFAGPPAAFADPLYGMTFLPQDFHAAGINNAGQVVGTARGGAAIWSSPSSVMSLGALLPGSEGLGINNRGDIVGRYGDYAFVYAGGVPASIVTDHPGWATGINDAGVVTGTVSFGGIGGATQSGFIYTGGTTTLFSPDYPYGTNNVANAINNAGVAVGTMTTGGHWSDPDRQAFTFSTSGGVLDGHGTLGGTISEGEDINDAGAFAGWSTNPDGSAERALLYSAQDGMQDLGTLGGTSARAHGLNNLGWVVGMSDVGAGEGLDTHAFLYRDHGMVDLNSLVAPPDGWRIVTAEDVNDAGQILAQACRAASGECQFVRLDLLAPVPEPSVWAMLLAGLGLVGLARRRARRRLATLATLAGPALLAAPLAAHAGNVSAFTMTAVPTAFSARAIDNAGRIVGTWQAGGPGQAAAVWDGRTVTTLALAPDSVGYGINDLGHVVGVSRNAEAFISTPAGVRDLGRFGYWSSSDAVAVNNADEVAGNGYWGLGEEYRGWVNTHGVLRMIGTFGGDWSVARAINKWGFVVGTASLVPFRSPYGDTRAFVYHDRMLKDLGTLGDGISSRANDINDAGQIVGASEYAYNGESSGPMHPFLYQDRIMRDLGTLGGTDGAANGINNAGAVVGYSMLAEGYTTHAFLYEHGRLRDLNRLTNVAPGWTLVDATDINDRRQILARACRNEDCVMVRLDPVAPTP